MLEKKNYANGQPTHNLEDNILTYFFKSGKIKAFGGFENEQMQGEWIFYRESKGTQNHLWQVANFLDNAKHGEWKRYSRNDELEYHETFNKGKKL